MFFLLYELFSKKVANYCSLSSRLAVSVKIRNKSIKLSNLFFITCSILKIQKLMLIDAITSEKNWNITFPLLLLIENMTTLGTFGILLSSYCIYTYILFAKFPFLRKIAPSLPENHSFSKCVVSIGFLLSPRPTF